MIEQITQLQKKLKLSQSLLEFSESIEYQSKDQFILELLQKLYNERYEKIIERNLKAAKFTILKTFDDYSFTGIEFPDTLTTDALKALEFINNRENLILYGGVGCGNYRKKNIIERNEF